MKQIISLFLIVIASIITASIIYLKYYKNENFIIESSLSRLPTIININEINSVPSVVFPIITDSILEKYGPETKINGKLISAFKIIDNGTSFNGQQQYLVVLFLNKNYSTKKEFLTDINSTDFIMYFRSIKENILAELKDNKINEKEIFEYLFLQKNGMDINDLKE